jgi:hypothetical protein
MPLSGLQIVHRLECSTAVSPVTLLDPLYNWFNRSLTSPCAIAFSIWPDRNLSSTAWVRSGVIGICFGLPADGIRTVALGSAFRGIADFPGS